MNFQRFQADHNCYNMPVFEDSDILFKIRDSWPMYSNQKMYADYSSLSNNYHLEVNCENNKQVGPKYCSANKVDFGKKPTLSTYSDTFFYVDPNSPSSNKMSFNGLTYLVGGFVGSKSQMYTERTSFDLWSLINKMICDNKISDPSTLNKCFKTNKISSEKKVETSQQITVHETEVCLQNIEENIKRARTPSLCSVESDSIVFEDIGCYLNNEDTDEFSDDESTYCADDFLSDDECDFESGIFSQDEELNLEKERIQQANDIWEKYYGDVDLTEDKTVQHKVSFSDKIIIHHMIVWNFAYRAARCGQCSQIAADRERFKAKILNLELVINPILDPEHRSKVYKSMFKTGR